MKDTIIWQRVEGALVFVAALALFTTSGSDLPWWAALALFFAPDLSFFAYGMGPRIGSWGYNLVHVYAFGLGLLAIGSLMGLPLLVGLGALWLGHCGFDRMLGYGLKSETSFQDTHLGRIGKKK
jgi:hypothetical protein